MRKNKQECTIFFRRYHDGTEVKMKIPHSESGIPELVDMFLDFLRGAGFVDPEQHVLENMMDYEDQIEYSIPTHIPKEVQSGTKKSFTKR